MKLDQLKTVSKPHLILMKARRGARLCAHKPGFIDGEREFRDRLKPVPKLPLTTNLAQPILEIVSPASECFTRQAIGTELVMSYSKNSPWPCQFLDSISAFTGRARKRLG